MWLTEKQGGSDVRANTTTATPLDGGGPGGEYEVVGHKWFCSAPMCDAFLVLAQTDGGLSCFLLPRWTPDGERNAFRIQRLKDKMGNRSNALAEVELDGAWAQMVGEEGRGVRTIIEMVNHTRLDCTIGAASGLSGPASSQALHHTAHRAAFGKELIDQPLMRNVLADLCVESEAATVSAMRLARAYDEAAAGDEAAAAFKRIATAVLKYWTCKRGPAHAAESLECLGGNGFIEESGMPRLFRESAAELDLGGLGQRAVPRRAARHGRRPRPRSTRSSPRSRRAPAPSRASTPTPRGCVPSSRATSRRSSRGPGESSRRWRSRCRPPCSSATATRPSPTRSAPPGSRATGATPSAPSHPAPTSPASSSATARRP